MKHKHWWIIGQKVPQWVLEQTDFMVFADDGGVWFQTTDLENPEAYIVNKGQEVVKTADGTWLFDGVEVTPR